MPTHTYRPAALHTPKETSKPIRQAEEKFSLKTGYLLLIVSFFLFALFDWVSAKEERYFMVFIVHYFLALTYAGILIFHKRYGIARCWKKENIHHTVILLNLFLISAYALNRTLPVFADSTDWLCAYLLISSFTMLSFRLFKKIPGWSNNAQFFLLGSAMVLYLYLTVYIGSFYVLGTIAIIGLGIGAHVFVPVTLLIAAIALVTQNSQGLRRAYYWMAAGVLITAGYAGAFVLEWNSRLAKMEKILNQSVIYTDHDLPAWVKISETISNDWITQRILRSDLVYTTARERVDLWDVPFSSQWDEVIKHDPLVVLGTLGKKVSLTEQDRIRILTAISDARHKSVERLWSGENLVTSYVVSDIDIYPELRIAYTEKYLNIRNNDTRDRWRNMEEAIYTFQLPEGSVVTSLSLWVNGKEEKAILTSKQKASEAYNTIVGKEFRDPSVIHWQEGNTVTVRVFPCTPDEERKVKIGITTPLQVNGEETEYRNITFRGPGTSDARETVRLRFVGSAGMEAPAGFSRDVNGDFILEHAYEPDFSLAFKTIPMKNNRFSFDGYVYALHDYKPLFRKVTFDRIFLDINNSWTARELQDLEPLVSKYRLYACRENGFVQLTDENWSEEINTLRQRNFSLFPFHRLDTPERSLVITKGKLFSPHLTDFKESTFAHAVSDFFGRGKKVNVYNLEGGISAYTSTFRELRGLEFAEGDIEQLTTWLSRAEFPYTEESDEQIVLHDARMAITKTKKGTESLSNNAPDHLVRLFAYNNIMRKVGAHYFKDDFVNDELVTEASTAYVVSPVSSLIVLETQADYERFGIKDNSNSLHNATKQSSGAVPEPHEWALIVLFVLFVIYLKIRS
jgi:XrtN system VIT domain protein